MIYSQIRPFNADTYTPVQLYLQLRNHFRNCCLLESNEYHSRQDSRSYIGFDPILDIQLEEETFRIREGQTIQSIHRDETIFLTEQVQQLLEAYPFENAEHNGFFGRISFEFSHSDETHLQGTSGASEIPLLHLFVFRYIVVIDHFTNEGFLLENSFDGAFSALTIEGIMQLPTPTQLPFEIIGTETASMTDDAFADAVKKGIEHCKRGDVFQLVLSNEFQQTYFGDDFLVYRQLRRTNPSPYLFYFDFESYRLFGSSPEAHLIVRNSTAEIHPIAGTVPRTGDTTIDAQQLAFLQSDAKENAEHTMLVDLARNDLSRNCTDVNVASYKEVQTFSHVFHLVSKVTGRLKHSKTFQAISESFPAGTLSGTPKSRALEIIHQYEQTPRDWYGGAIGLIQPNGDANTAIVIRSILSKENRLHYRAGAGIVLDSDPNREAQEVHHKLRAVRTAIQLAHAHQAATEKIHKS